MAHVANFVDCLPAGYRQVRRLGDGAEGGSFAAREPGSGTRVVLKPVATGDIPRLKAAVAVLGRSASPHLPALRGLAPGGQGTLWLVTDWVEGEPLTWGPVAEPIQALAEALGVAHGLGAIHRTGLHHGDVSLANVIRTPTRATVLVDLAGLGRPGGGTPGFIAPEVLAGGGGAPADLFSLGSLLCARLFGEVPWRRPEALLALGDPGAVSRRLAELTARKPVAREILALLEGLLDPVPSRRLQADGAVEHLLRLAGQGVGGLRSATRWWIPRRWPYRSGEPQGQLPTWGPAARLALIVGPPHSGRGRLVEELITRRQALADGPAVLADGPDLAPALEARGLGPGGIVGGWLEAWLRARAGTLVGLRRAPQFDGDPERWGATLAAVAHLAQATLIVPVDGTLAEAVRRHAGGDSNVVWCSTCPWSPIQVEGALEGVLHGDRTAWARALVAATGGWSGQVLRLVGACAALGLEDPDPTRLRSALTQAPDDGSMDPTLARAVLQALWCGDRTGALGTGSSSGAQPAASDPGREALLAGRHDGRGPLPTAVAAARAALGPAGVRAWAQRLAAGGLVSSDPRGALWWALDRDDAEAIEAAALGSALDPADPATEAWLGWLEGRAERGTPATWVLGARCRLAQGDGAAALTLARRPGTKAPGALEAARALQRLGRAEEALTVALTLCGQDDPELARSSEGLVLRALVDLGRLGEARARSQALGPHTGSGLGWATVRLWSAYGALAAGDAAGAATELERVEQALEKVEDPRREGLMGRALQLAGNLAHGRGDLSAAARAWRAAAQAFARGSEPVGELPLRGSLAALAICTFDGAEGIDEGRACVRGLLARGEVEALVPAALNLVQLLGRHGLLDEARAVVRTVGALVAGPQASGAMVARHRRMQAELKVWDHGGAEVSDGFGRAGEALAQAGLGAEAAEAHLRAAAWARRFGAYERARRHLDAVRALPEGDAVALELEELELAAAIGQIDRVDAVARRLAGHIQRRVWLEQGRLDRCWALERALWSALSFRLPRHHPIRMQGTQRLASVLEKIMSKTPPHDRAAVRKSLWQDGQAEALRELVEELGEDPKAAARPSSPDGSAGAEPAAPTERPWVAASDAPRFRVGGPASSAQAEGAEKLLRIYRRLAREDRLEPLLEQVIDAVMELTEAERGAMVVLQHDNTRREVTRELMAQGDGVQFSRSVIERVLRSGEPVLSVDAASDDRFDGSQSVSHLNLRSVLAAPLRFRGELLGAVYVDHRLRRGNFDEGDLARLEQFADLAALAVAQARAVENLRRQAETLAQQAETLAELLAAREVEVAGLRARVGPSLGAGERFGLIGSGPAMAEVIRLVERLADHDAPVLIYGESGTGKELVARAIHQAGGRHQAPFIAENCAAIPETLLESILFGHARGAFTGADKARPGLFEAAHGGSIFLDEVGEMSPGMQAKLLRVLQEGEVRRVGENTPRKVDVRLIAASNRDLAALVKTGQFRQDLFYRIHVVRLDLPPLRERTGDLPELVECFLARHGGAHLRVSPGALRALAAYPWPGNIRELENEVQRWVALCDGTVGEGDLSPALRGQTAQFDPADLRIRPRVERLERQLIAEAMAQVDHNQTRAAERLGLSRFGLQKKLRKLQLLKP